MYDDSSILQQINSALGKNDIPLFLNLCNNALSNNNLSNKVKGQVSFTLGSYYREIGDNQNAIISFSKALSYDNEKLYAYIRKTELLISLNRLPAAAHCCNEGLNKFPSDSNLLKLKASLEKAPKIESSDDSMKPNNSTSDNTTPFNTAPINNDINSATNVHNAVSAYEADSAYAPSSNIDTNYNPDSAVDNDYIPYSTDENNCNQNTTGKSNYNSNTNFVNEKVPHEIDFGNSQTPNKEYKSQGRKNNTPLIIACSVLCTLVIGGLCFFGYMKFMKSNNDVDNLLTAKSNSKEDKNTSDSTDKKATDDKDKKDDNKKGTNDTTLGKSATPKEKYLVNNENPNAPFSGSLPQSKDFIFKDSDKIKLNYSDLVNKTLDELFVARNEIFARHGYIFTSSTKLNTYFQTKSWYTPNSSYTGNISNGTEEFNADLIKQVEVARIAHYNYGDKLITGFVISDSDKRALTANDVKNLQDWELIIARNEIFARHGLRFGVPQISDHFTSQSWYTGDPNFDASKMSKLECDNVEVIKKEELTRYTKLLTR